MSEVSEYTVSPKHNVFLVGFCLLENISIPNGEGPVLPKDYPPGRRINNS